MIRRSAFSNRVRLAVTQLEDRVVPSGMIEVREWVGDSGTQYLNITGDKYDNHVRVSPSGADMIVTSNTGPIKYTTSAGTSTISSGPLVLPADIWSRLATQLRVYGLRGNDNLEVIGDVWAVIYIEGAEGNDRVFLDAMTNQCDISTGAGSDIVEIWNSQVLFFTVSTDPSLPSKGNDRVTLRGTNSFFKLEVFLGAGDDVLEGDTTPGAGLLPLSRSVAGEPPMLYLKLFGGVGKDTILNAAYFQPPGAVVSIWDFETIR